MNWDQPLDEPARCEPPEEACACGCGADHGCDGPLLVEFVCPRCSVKQRVPEANVATCWICGKRVTLVKLERMEAA
jgi:hypothetical protein